MLLVTGRDKPFFLIDQAAPCSFQRNNYDDWFRFGLILPVPIDMRNALSRKAYRDQRPRNSPAGRRGIVYFISRPEFTDDGQYAVIDTGFRCDGRQGGMGATCLFRKNKGSWQLAGKKTA